MRKFFVFRGRGFQKYGRVMSFLYLCCALGFSYRMVYNEFYTEIHKDIEVNNENGDFVYPLGEIVGIYTECEGVFVIDTCEIENAKGEFVNPAGNLLRTGDYILSVNGIELEEKEMLVEAVEKSDGAQLELMVSRGETMFSADITPVLSKNGKYMLGVWVKDDLAGVGTITYVDESGNFAALGHGMSDGETSELLEVKGGDIYNSKIIGIEKGKKGAPGEVKGIIYYGVGNHLGELDTNCGEGIYGTLDEEDAIRYKDKEKTCKMGNKQEIVVGPAQIISDVSGERDIYDIEITYIDYLAVNSNKGLHIEVTDPDLLKLTGGIVQGMSGSPIIQNGKLIGAVTHVLINDPTSGYGIFIDEMLHN